MARRIQRRQGKGFKNSLRGITDDALKAAVAGLRNAAKEVLNDLVEASPEWRGGFKESWYVEADNGTRGVRQGTVGSGYQLWNIPLIPLETARKGKIELRIGNSAPYATQAMDLEPGTFYYPGVEPKKPVVLSGARQDGIRGKIKQGEGNNRATAPLNWYATYMEGGAFRAACAKGFNAGFLQPVNRPRFNAPPR